MRGESLCEKVWRAVEERQGAPAVAALLLRCLLSLTERCKRMLLHLHCSCVLGCECIYVVPRQPRVGCGAEQLWAGVTAPTALRACSPQQPPCWPQRACGAPPQGAPQARGPGPPCPPTRSSPGRSQRWTSRRRGG